MKVKPTESDYMEGFSLLEVLIATAIFFIAMFSILELTSRNLRAARHLSPTHADISELALPLVLTNRFTDGDLGSVNEVFEFHPNHTCIREIVPAGTNGWFRIDFTIIAEGRGVESRSSIYLYKPQSRLTIQF